MPMKRLSMVVSLIVCISILDVGLAAGGKTGGRPAEQKLPLGDLAKWTFVNRRAETVDYRGRQGLRLDEARGSGAALFEGVDFVDGTIELDIAAIPRFTGLVFRVRDDDVYEGIYFRPQNSRHPDPAVRARTVQYISHPGRTWYYLRDRYPGRYEAAVDLAPEEWFQVKVTVSGCEARVFVNGSETPCLVVDELLHGYSSGTVGVWCGNGSGGTFSGLEVTHSSERPSDDAGRDDVIAPASYSPEQEYLFDLFKKRRSIRKFRPDPVPDEHIMKILDMARTAPTSGNQQPWKFFVIKDRAKLDELKDACIERRLESSRAGGITDPEELGKVEERAARYYGDYLSAPVYVAVLVDSTSRYPAYNRYDGSLAGGYLMLAARALGYGTVFSQDSIPYDLIRDIFGIPEMYERICFTPIGVPVSWPEPPEKKRLGDLVVFEKFMENINYTPPVRRTAIVLGEDVLESYVGTYEATPEYKLEVSREGGRLFAQGSGQARVEIFPEAETRFFLKAADVQIEFQKDDSGLVTGLVIVQGENRAPAKRID